MPALFVAVFFIVRAIKKRSHSTQTERKNLTTGKPLGDTLKSYRTNCKMTQEFVAESLGVSRQAVSKWENGTSDPSTSNLFALAKLYGVSVDELLNGSEAISE